MSGPSDKQLSYARAMSDRQWAVLGRLVDGKWFLSASERCDPELHALTRRGFAICDYAKPSRPGGDLVLPMWTATDVGRALIKIRASKALWK